MKPFQKIVHIVLMTAFLSPLAAVAQKEGEDKDSKKKEAEQIIITRKGSNDEKIVVEIVGDKITLNGKPIDDKDSDITVKRHKVKDIYAFGGNGDIMQLFGNNNSALTLRNNAAMGELFNSNRAMLGVSTEKADKGVKVVSITKESAAEKAGLKEGDIITKVGDKTITTSDELSEAVKKHKPGDKVSVTYTRDKKETKATAELTKWKGVTVYGSGQNFNFDFPSFEAIAPRLEQFRATTPHVRTVPKTAFSWPGSNGPKLGLSVQDTEDGKGVKVLEADKDGNGAKAGIKENDILLEVDGKAVNSTDEVAKVMRENKDKVIYKVKLLRNGKTENLEIKIPRPLKTRDL